MKRSGFSSSRPSELKFDSEHFVLAIKQPPNKNGLYQLYVRYTKARKSNFLRLELLVKPEALKGQWLNKDIVAPEDYYHVAKAIKRLDGFITEYLDEFKVRPDFEMLKDYFIGGVKDVKEAVQKVENENFDFFRIKNRLLSEEKRRGKIGARTIELYSEAERVFRRYLNFIGKNGITIIEMNSPDFFKELEHYLIEYKKAHIHFLNIKDLPHDTVFTERLRKDFINNYLDKFSEEKRVSKNSSVVCITQMLLKVMTYCFTIGLIETPHFKRYTPLQKNQKPIVGFMDDDISYIKSLFFYNNYMYDFRKLVLAQWYSGRRIGEVMAMTTDNIFIDKNDEHKCYLMGWNQKGKENYFTPLDGEALEFFKKLKDEKVYKGEKRCFKDYDYGTLSKFFKRLLKDYPKEIELDGKPVLFRNVVTMHSLRKGAITRWHAIAGYGLAKRISGHKSERAFNLYLDMTQRYELLSLYHSTKKKLDDK